MIAICKMDEPEELRKWKVHFAHKKGRKARYDDISNDQTIYKLVKQNLYHEQHGLCCYCCNEIENLRETHIEHLKPQSKYPKNTTDYSNMLLSCNGIFSKRETCGHRKEDKEQIVSPLDPTCTSRFAFSNDGRMKETSQQDYIAKQTIDCLNLNDARLAMARQIAMKAAGVFEDMDENERLQLAQYFMIPDNMNRLPAFCDAITFDFLHF